MQLRKGIQIVYLKLIHVTCLAHGLHRLCESIRTHYSDVDNLIAYAKKNVLKSSSRIQIFKQFALGEQLPLEPIITRWRRYGLMLLNITHNI